MFTENTGGIPNIITSGGKEEGGFGWSGMWVFALVLVFFALVFWRRDSGESRNPLTDIAAISALNNGGAGGDARAAFTEINGRFDALSQQVSHINDVNDLRDLKSTQAALGLQIAGNRTDTLLNFKDLSLQVAQGNSGINQNIDGVRFQAAQNTCDIIRNQDCNAQKILDRLSENEITRLRDELARERLAASQVRQDLFIERQSDRVIGTLAPRPMPAYPSFPNGYAVNPAVYAGFAPAAC